VIHAAHGVNFVRGAWDKDDAVGLQASSAFRAVVLLWLSVFINQLPSKAVACIAALTESSVISRHCPANTFVDSSRLYSPAIARFHALDDRRAETSIVLELLCAVVDRDSSLFADELIVGALICVLETPPTTNVVKQNDAEVAVPAWTSSINCFKRVPAVYPQTLFP